MVRSVVRRLAPAVVVFCTLATSPVPGAAAVIDSFTDILPPNPLMAVSGRPVLFLNWACDGAACPPASLVHHPSPWDGATQTGLAGVYGGWRFSSIGSVSEALTADGDYMLRIDPAGGGRLVLAPYGEDCYVALQWGDRWGTGLNLDLGADGGDRFEIDLSAPRATFGELHLYSLDANGDLDGEAVQLFTKSSSGTVSLPYAAIRNLATFSSDVDVVSLMLFAQPSPGGEVAIAEVRTNGGAVPATTSSWGRVKAAYQR